MHLLRSSILSDLCAFSPLTNPLTFRQVLLVSEDKNDGVPHLSIVNDPVKFLPGLVYPVSVRTVDHENEPLGAGVVVTPERSDLVLTSNILPWNNNVTLLTIVYLICLELTQTLNLTFLYVTVSTLNPTVGIVFTDCPSFSLYSIVVFPAASNPSIKILISLLPNTLDRIFPMLIKLLLNLWTNNGWIEVNL